MPLTRFAASGRCNVSGFALAMAVTLLPGLIRPQTASAQRAGAYRRPAGGGTAPHNMPPQMRLPAGATFNPGPRRPAHYNTPPRSVFRPSGTPSRPPLKPGRAALRARRSPVILRHVFNYYAPKYRLTGRAWSRYFPSGAVYYTHYALKNASRGTAPSVYYYYADVFPAYIAAAYVINQPPQTAYVYYPSDTSDTIEGPGQNQSGNDNGSQIGLTAVPAVARQDLMLARAMSDIETAWTLGDIRFLSRHVRQDASVAVYLKGKYFYSLDADNYLSMTRDALSTTRTVSFTLDQVQQQGLNVYTVSGRHTYTNRHEEGDIRTVLVCYVLKRGNGNYYITQVGTAPVGETADDPTGAQNSPAGAPGGDNLRALAVPGMHAYPDDMNVPKHTLSGPEWDDYFPSRTTYYPHYSLNYFAGTTTYSPYYDYGAAFPPYIAAASGIHHPPQDAYVRFPAATSSELHSGARSDDPARKNASTNIASVTARDPLLAHAVADLDTVWSRKDIRYLSRHMHRDTPIAVFLNGNYAYSLDGGDYLNLTHDALSAKTTVNFVLDRVQREAWDIYSVSGHHTYTDRGGKIHEVQISYVLQKVDDDYYLMQVGTERVDAEQ